MQLQEEGMQVWRGVHLRRELHVWLCLLLQIDDAGAFYEQMLTNGCMFMARMVRVAFFHLQIARSSTICLYMIAGIGSFGIAARMHAQIEKKKKKKTRRQSWQPGELASEYVCNHVGSNLFCLF